MKKDDRLSNLPITILHDIISRLPMTYGARTSVLSKAWAETWSTFPNLSLSDTKIIGKKRKNFIESEDYLSKKKKFLDYVDKTLLRFRSQGLLIKQFGLSVKCFDLHNLSKDVDHWLKLVSESGVEMLLLWQPLDELKEEEVNDKCYILPTCVLEAKSLTKLVLKTRIGVDLSFIDRSIKFFSLQYLYLEDVLLRDEHALKYLISCCPLIEYIILRKCYVLKPGGNGEWCLHKSSSSQMKSVCMCGLPRLKEVSVLGIREVCVDSPCLERLQYFPGDFKNPSKIDFDKCKNLRELYLGCLRSTISTSKWFLELFAKYPFLDTVTLDRCQMSETINISSVQLKILSLIRCLNLKEVHIDAPNLLSCHYEGRHDENSISFQRWSSQLNVNVMVHIYNMNFSNFGELIKNFKSLTVLTSVSLRIYELRVALDPVNIQAPSLPPNVKHLDLQVLLKDEAFYLPLLNKLFSSCCPTTISLTLNSYCCREFIEFLFGKLLGRDAFGCDTCHNGPSKCWLHRLKDVKLKSPMKIVEDVDFKNMLDKLENSPYQPRNISFKLEF